MIPREKTTIVLLATYNGARYIEAQIQSLLAQSQRVTRILVRDDGSKDSTRDLVQALALKDERIVLLAEHHNLGVTSNFFALIAAAGDSYDYYAFCDQDDVWLEDKLARAVQALEARDATRPCLYFSRLSITDEGLTVTGQSPVPSDISFENAISQNVVTGCTAVINREAYRLIQQTPFGHPDVWSHDWWLYVVISYFGELVYDETPGILYRQHGGNVMGSKASPLARFRQRVQHASRKKLETQRPSRLVRALVDIYGPRMQSGDLVLLRALSDKSLGVWQRLPLAFNRRLRRQTLVDTWILRLRFILGDY